LVAGVIKFTMQAKDGALVIGLGLTDENWRRLRLGQPIVVKLREMIDSDLEILLIGGETEYTLTEQLAPMIGPKTVLRRE
jgi:hypothetical protein